MLSKRQDRRRSPVNRKPACPPGRNARAKGPRTRPSQAAPTRTDTAVRLRMQILASSCLARNLPNRWLHLIAAGAKHELDQKTRRMLQAAPPESPNTSLGMICKQNQMYMRMIVAWLFPTTSRPNPTQDCIARGILHAALLEFPDPPKQPSVRTG